MPVNTEDSIDLIQSPIHNNNSDKPIDAYLVVSSTSVNHNDCTELVVVAHYAKMEIFLLKSITEMLQMSCSSSRSSIVFKI